MDIKDIKIEPINHKEGKGMFHKFWLVARGIAMFRDWHIWLGEHFGFRMKHGKFRLRNGTVFFVNPSEGDNVAAIPETYLLKRYTRYYTPKDNDCVIDVGAAIGEFAIFAASLSPRIRVYAYEPDHRPFKRLKRAVEENGMQNRVLPFNLALAAKSGETLVESKGNIFFDDTSFKVAATTLEDIFSEHKIARCDLLKVDIEGAEFDVLMNAPANVFARIRHIALEYHDNPRRLMAFLERNGYAVKAFSSSNQCGYLYADK